MSMRVQHERCLYVEGAQAVMLGAGSTVGELARRANKKAMSERVSKGIGSLIRMNVNRENEFIPDEEGRFYYASQVDTVVIDFMSTVSKQKARIAELEAQVKWEPVEDSEQKCGCANESCTRVLNVGDDGREIALSAYRDSGMSIRLGALRICRPVQGEG